MQIARLLSMRFLAPTSIIKCNNLKCVFCNFIFIKELTLTDENINSKLDSPPETHDICLKKQLSRTEPSDLSLWQMAIQ